MIDAGLMRPRFDPRTGLNQVGHHSRHADAVDQRRGRAGRLEAAPVTVFGPTPSIRHSCCADVRRKLEADLAPSHWIWRNGVLDAKELSWLILRRREHWRRHGTSFRQPGALDAQGALTAHGRRLAHVTAHPRLAHMMVSAVPLGWGPWARIRRAVQRARHPARRPWLAQRRLVDCAWRRYTATRQHLASATINRGSRLSSSEQRGRQLQLGIPSGDGIDHIGILLAFAYPDRVAQRLVGSDGTVPPRQWTRRVVPGQQGLAGRLPAVAQLDGTGDWARILAAAPVRLQDLNATAHSRSTPLMCWNGMIDRNGSCATPTALRPIDSGRPRHP